MKCCNTVADAETSDGAAHFVDVSCNVVSAVWTISDRLQKACWHLPVLGIASSYHDLDDDLRRVRDHWHGDVANVHRSIWMNMSFFHRRSFHSLRLFLAHATFLVFWQSSLLASSWLESFPIAFLSTDQKGSSAVFLSVKVLAQ